MAKKSREKFFRCSKKNFYRRLGNLKFFKANSINKSWTDGPICVSWEIEGINSLTVWLRLIKLVWLDDFRASLEFETTKSESTSFLWNVLFSLKIGKFSNFDEPKSFRQNLFFAANFGIRAEIDRWFLWFCRSERKQTFFFCWTGRIEQKMDESLNWSDNEAENVEIIVAKLEKVLERSKPWSRFQHHSW